MMAKRNLSLVLATGYHARARPLWEGRVDTGDLRLKVIPFRNDGERHQRFLDGEFDGAEFSLALYLALKNRGASLEAIPVFPNRRFRHSFIFVREDSPLKDPAGLKGKSVGIPNYLNTCGLWVRGLLGDEYGLEVRDIRWKALRKEPVDISLPPGTHMELLPDTEDLKIRLLRGEVDAAITPEIPEGKGIGPILSRAKEVEKDYYRRTSVYPISHAIVIRRHILAESPWVAEELFRAWSEAKRLSLEDDADPTYSNFAWVRDLWEEEREVLGPDPWRYGISANKEVIETLIRYAVEQGIMGANVEPGKLFLPID